MIFLKGLIFTIVRTMLVKYLRKSILDGSFMIMILTIPSRNRCVDKWIIFYHKTMEEVQSNIHYINYKITCGFYHLICLI